MLEDDGDGIVRLVQVDDVSKTRIYDVGTIDYENGLVSLQNIQVDNYLGESVIVYVKPADADISVKGNTILTIEESGININVEQLRL